MSGPKEEARRLAAIARERSENLSHYSDLLEKYASVPRSDQEPAELLVLLQRYNSIWRSPRPMSKVGLPGFIRIIGSDPALSKIEALVRQPLFYRMNFIRQLSTTNLWRHLEASHSRLAHCLGVAQAAYRFLEAINRQLPGLVTPSESLAVLVYAFIHDSFHGPLGHSLELMRDVFVPGYAGRLDKYFLQSQLNDPNSDVAKAIRSAMPDGDEILKLLALLGDKPKFKRQQRDKFFLAQIVDSRFDADRIDYIFRDTIHLGAGKLPREADVAEVIERVKILPVDDDDVKGKVQSLCFSLPDKPLIEEILGRRRQLYVDFYEHPLKIIVDEMICHVLYYILLDRKIIPDPILAQRETIAEIGRLVDPDFFHFFYEAGGPLYAQLMLRDVLVNDPFEEVHRTETKISKALVEGSMKLKEAFETEVEKRRLERAKPTVLDLVELSHEEKVDILKELMGADRDVMLFYFMYTVAAGGFSARHNIECLLWKRLLKSEDFSEKLRLAHLKKYGTLGPQLYEQLVCDRFPQVHISTPSYVSSSGTELMEHAKERSGETMAFYDDRDEPRKMELRLPSIEAYEKIYVLVSAAPFLSSEDNVTELIKKEFEALLTGLEWADLRWLGGV